MQDEHNLTWTTISQAIVYHCYEENLQVSTAITYRYYDGRLAEAPIILDICQENGLEHSSELSYVISSFDMTSSNGILLRIDRCIMDIILLDSERKFNVPHRLRPIDNVSKDMTRQNNVMERLVRAGPHGTKWT